MAINANLSRQKELKIITDSLWSEMGVLPKKKKDPLQSLSHTITHPTTHHKGIILCNPYHTPSHTPPRTTKA